MTINLNIPQQIKVSLSFLLLQFFYGLGGNMTVNDIVCHNLSGQRTVLVDNDPCVLPNIPLETIQHLVVLRL